MSRVDVTVLVPVLNEERYIEETARAMLAQSFDGELEVLFIDGGSEDATRAVLERISEEDARVRVLDNPERRTPNALNVGLSAARGEYVARMDAHSWYPPTYLADGVRRLQKGDVDWVTGPAIPRPAGRWSRRIALALGTPLLGQGGSRKWLADPAGGAEEVELDTGVFAGVWRRSTLERHGGWDEGWPVNQDAEMAARVLAAGGRIVCVRALAAQYAPRESLAGLARQYWRFGYYRVKTTRRHPSALRRAHLLPVALVASVLTAVLPGLPGWLARRGLVAYGVVMGAGSGFAPGRPQPADVAALPVVFATMHVAWGMGFLAGCVRMGPPLAAVASAIRGNRAVRAPGSSA